MIGYIPSLVKRNPKKFLFSSFICSTILFAIAPGEPITGQLLLIISGFSLLVLIGVPSAYCIYYQRRQREILRKEFDSGSGLTERQKEQFLLTFGRSDRLEASAYDICLDRLDQYMALRDEVLSNLEEFSSSGQKMLLRLKAHNSKRHVNRVELDASPSPLVRSYNQHLYEITEELYRTSDFLQYNPPRYELSDIERVTHELETHITNFQKSFSVLQGEQEQLKRNREKFLARLDPMDHEEITVPSQNFSQPSPQPHSPGVPSYGSCDSTDLNDLGSETATFRMS